MSDSQRIDYKDVVITDGESAPRTDASVVPDQNPPVDAPEGIYSTITGKKIEPRVVQ